MKLSKRLQQLDAMVTQDYDHIWDTCCDHGHLGITLLQRNASPNIHFVDIVPTLINHINEKIKYLNNHKIKTLISCYTYCMSTADIPISSDNKRHLVIIAGVGGDLVVELLQALCAKHPLAKIDFLLCPIRQQYRVRKCLIDLDLGLINEALVYENKLFYEVILVSNQKTALPSVHPVGEQLWTANNREAYDIASCYLARVTEHYQRASQQVNSLQNCANKTSSETHNEATQAFEDYARVEVKRLKA